MDSRPSTTRTIGSRSYSSSDADERALRASPKKPYETADVVPREPLVPCGICGRNFSSVTLERHTPICERISQKPKRDAFKAIAQRLAHVAQESAVRPIIQQSLQEKFVTSRKSPLQSPKAPPPVKAPPASKRRSPTVRTGNTGVDLFREQQKGLLQCPCCQRTFKEDVHGRHVEFCTQQHTMKLQKNPTVDPKADLLLKRMKYRPPLPKSLSKDGSPARKSVSAFESVSSKSYRMTEVSCSTTIKSRSSMAAVTVPSKFSNSVDSLTVRLRDVRTTGHVHEKSTPKTTLPAIRRIMSSSSSSESSLGRLSSINKVTESKPAKLPPVPKQRKSLAAATSILQRTTLLCAGDAIQRSDHPKTSPRAPERKTLAKPRETKKASPEKFDHHSKVEPWLDHMDSFLLPAGFRTQLTEYDKSRFFHRIGGTYRAPPPEKREYIRLPEIPKSCCRTEREESSSPSSESGSDTPAEWDGRKTTTSFLDRRGAGDNWICDQCSKPFPIPEAAFCCHCGSLRKIP